MSERFVLASASPARYATLLAAGVRPEVIVSDLDESAFDEPAVAQLVQTLAEAKAHRVADRLESDAVVLGCDSLLEFDGTPWGKPLDLDEARSRWKRMRGRSGVLHTGHSLLLVRAGLVTRSTGRSVPTTVRFAEVTDAEIEAYLASGEPLHVAGAFTVDGLGGWFVESVEGDHHTVVGVSLPALRELLAELDLGLTDLGWPTPA